MDQDLDYLKRIKIYSMFDFGDEAEDLVTEEKIKGDKNLKE
jgi:hypothetical protein